MKYLDRFLNSITMYRLILWGLALLAFWSIILAVVHQLPFSVLSLLLSAALLLPTAVGTNALLSRLLRTTSNVESASITALILFFIFTPPTSFSSALWLVLAALIAIGLKHILLINRTHVINPAALAAVLVGIATGTAHWWIATSWMLVPTLIVGLAIAYKIRRLEMIGSFALALAGMKILVAPLAIGVPIGNLDAMADTLKLLLISSPTIFLGTFMLTEPLTTPPTRILRILYGALVGILAATPFQIGLVSMTPELALVIGNITAFFWQPRHRFKLQLKQRSELTHGLYEFIFDRPETCSFVPGQYIECTFGHGHPDSRGNRRYFSIASSPDEPMLRLVMRIPTNPSTFKQSLLKLKPGEHMIGSHTAGDFTLPTDTSKKLVFIAGGVGITPFSSMIRHMILTNEHRDIVLFYASRTLAGCIDVPVLDNATSLGVKSILLPTDIRSLSSDWSGPSGALTDRILHRYVPDLHDRTYFISGPTAMVDSHKQLLRGLGIQNRHIHTDYFSGY